MTRDLLLVSISLFTWGLGEGMFIFFQPLYLQQLGADPRAIGGILGGVGIAMTVAHLPAGYISDRFGQRPLMWASWIIGLVATGIMALSSSITVFIIGMLMYAFTAFVVSPMNSYVAAVRGKLEVGWAFSIMQSMYNLGAVIGPTLGGIIAQQSSIVVIYRWAFLVFCISTAIIFFIRKTIPQPHLAAQPGEHVFTNRRFLAILPLLFLTTFGAYLPQPLTSNFLQNQRHLSLETIGNLGSIGSLGTSIIFLVLGKLNPILGLVLGQAFVGLFAGLLWQGNATIWYMLGFFFLGGFRLSRSMGMAFTQSLVHINSYGIAFGTVEAVNGLALVLAPLLAGFLFEQQPELIYLVALVLIFSSISLNIWLLPVLKRKHPAAVELAINPE
jgi:MFS family permease